MRGRKARLPGLGLLLVAVFACSNGSGDRSVHDPVRILVAASTKEAVEEVAGLYTKDTGVEVKVIAESSSRLATQIVHDAPADLFLSANAKWADYVAEKGYAHDTKPLLTNGLVLIVPRGNPAGISKPDDLGGKSVKQRQEDRLRG
jgi:molybdate transport system substrate-binding protein